MGIWEFDSEAFPTENLERILEINEELRDMGFDGLDEEMIAEVNAELARREEDEDAEDV